jgi:hypothetical protein
MKLLPTFKEALGVSAGKDENYSFDDVTTRTLLLHASRRPSPFINILFFID